MNATMETLKDRMRAKGLRMTSQRLILAELLESADEHLDAERVYQLARRKDPKIHRATVYRTLNTLKKLGLVDELDLMHVTGDRHFYEIRPSVFHIHLVCMRCGSVEEPGGPFWQDLKVRVMEETDFKPEIVRLEMGGTCTTCQRRAGSVREAGPRVEDAG
jgi:Fur family ferric uptake transcriptional regulator